MTAQSTEILLVEDRAADAELMVRALKANNLANRIKVVGDGAEALDYLRPDDPEYLPPDGYPRLVMLDLRLPRVSGLEVLKRLKASERTRLIPVVVMTSSQEESDLIESYKLGANSYVVKPVSFKDFMDVVGRLGMYWLLVNKVVE
jgi:two-component system response regulator